MTELEFREEMAKLGFYDVMKVTNDKVAFEVVNFDFGCKNRADFTVVMSCEGKIQVYDNVCDKLHKGLKAHEDILYSCNLNLKNINKAFELIKEFCFENK